MERISKAVNLAGLHGMGDNLHQRAIVRQLMQSQEVWLETPWPSIYHDLVGPGLNLVSKGSKLRTQAKNAQREAAFFSTAKVPQGAAQMNVHYAPAAVRQHRGVLQAMAAHCSVAPGDFRMPVPLDWRHGLDLPTEKPVMVFRPLIERTEWTGCKARNPDQAAYLALFESIRKEYFVVSVADLEPNKEWLAQPDIAADITLHAGQLDFPGLAALWSDADLVFTAPGFGVVLAQAVGTPVAAVFGGYEAGYSFSAGAMYSPTLAIEPVNGCDCFSHHHACDKRIDLANAELKLKEFIYDHCS